METKALGTYDIAEVCHVTPATVGNWIEKGLLPTFTTGGGHRRVWANDLIQFLKEHNIPIPGNLVSSNKIRILIVDDEEPIRKVVKRIIQKNYENAEIDEAADGFEAGQKISQWLPTLVILDLKLPGIDGFKVCRVIRANEELKKIKILAISGYNVESSREQAIESGADCFVGKPFSPDVLKEALDKLLGSEKIARDKLLSR